MFDPEALQTAVRQALAAAPASQVPEGHTRAILVAVDQDHAQVVFAQKIGSDWTVDADLSKVFRVSGLTAGVTVHGSW